MTDTRDPYASEAETQALLVPDTRTAAERKLAQMMTVRGADEQGAEAYPILRQIALDLLESKPTFTGLPKRKLNELLSAGWQINGVSIEREEATVTKRGAVTTGGMVLWWNQEQPAQPQDSGLTNRYTAPQPAQQFTEDAPADCKRLAEHGAPICGRCHMGPCKYTTPQAQPAPVQGWKLVPVKPTKEMITAGSDDLRLGGSIGTIVRADECYRAMLAAAPQPAQPQQEPTDSMGMPVSCGKPLCSPGDHHPLCKLAEQPAQQEPVATCSQEIIHAITMYGDARADQDANNAPMTSHERLADCILLVREALAEQPAQQEPVAWNDEQLQMLNFLYGAGDFDGVWFDQKHPTEKGAFWWRKHLRRLFDTPQAQPAREPLTEEQIFRLPFKFRHERPLASSIRAIARAIEAAHGIKAGS